MFNLVSIIIGIVALIFALIAFIPLLGWAKASAGTGSTRIARVQRDILNAGPNRVCSSPSTLKPQLS